MPVSVSLMELIVHRCPREWWPTEFAALAATIEAEPDGDKLPFGVLGDWCEANGEPELESACKFIHKKDVRLREGKQAYSYSPMFEFMGLPATVSAVRDARNDTPKTPLEAIAYLAKWLAIARAELE